MTVTFVLGRAGVGKTRHCLDALSADLGQPANENTLIFLVPEQASFQMERALAEGASRGGFWRAAVLSFSRLAQRALGEVGGSIKLLSPDARRMALRCAAARMGRSLHSFRTAAQTAGFYAQADRLIEELLRENVSWEALAAAARALPEAGARRKVAELARLYREYLQWLGPDRLDPALRPASLRERLAELPWLRDASIWVDGFAGFTGQELAALVALAQTARQITITLLLDPQSPAVRDTQQAPHPLNLFHRTEQTYQQLQNMFTAAGITCGQPIVLPPAPVPRFTEAPGLARLEAGLATPTPAASPTAGAPSPNVKLAECTTHRDELRAAARFIRESIADAGGRLRFSDFAVITRDLPPFASLIAEVFGEYDIPYFLDRRRPMGAHVLSRLIEALFAVIAGDFAPAATTRLLRTGLLPLTRAQAERLENIATAHAVRGVATWRQPRWDFSGDALQSVRPTGGDADAELDAARQALVAALEPLLQLAAADPPPSGAAWARGLHEVLESLDVPQRLAEWIAAYRQECRWEPAETHRLAWESLCEILEDLDDVLGAATLRAPDVAAILNSALCEQTLGLAPPTLDQVLVSSIERSRHPPIKYAWVFAFNQGIFPARPPEDVLLSAVERETLATRGLPAPASHRAEAFDERLLAYIAFTRPSHGLTISYATVDAGGAPLLPSPLLADVRQALPELEVKQPAMYAPPVCVTELALAYLHVRQQETPGAAERYERLCTQVRTSAAYAAQLAWLLRGATYHNKAATVDAYRPCPEAGVAWRGSPSEVETYLDCSFKHFAKYGLRLDATRAPRPLSWDLGSMAHEILADVTRRAMREPGGVRSLPDQRWSALVQEAVTEFRRRLPADVAHRRPDLAFLSELLYGFVAEVVAVHAQRWRRGRFEPAHCEQAFGARAGPAALPALELTTAAGQRVQLHGQIDRLDRCRTDRETLWLVYDYKSSVSPVAAAFLTGARLQLFGYLLAAQHAFGDQANTRVVGVFLAPLYPDLEVLKKGYAQAAPEGEQRMYMYRPPGMFTRDAAPLLDRQLGQNVSPVARMKLKKDGDFDSNQSKDVVDPAALEQRLELARRTLLLAAEGIAGGTVEAAPLVEGRTLACRWCDFRAVCRFDRALNRGRPAEIALPTLADLAGGLTT